MNKFNGWSGSSIELRDNRIYKTGGPRLLKQATKQLAFSQFSYPGISIPKIYSYSDSHIEMEYCNGKSFLEYANSIDSKNLERIADTLTGFVQANLERSNFQLVNKTVFINKTLEIFNKLSISKINLPDFKDLYLLCGPAHGDLTLSNIIFADDKLYLIDFLDCYLESPILDIVKLLQDCREQLTFSTRLAPILEKLNSKFWNLLVKYGADKYYNQLQFLNLARILPYIKDDENENRFNLIWTKMKLLRELGI